MSEPVKIAITNDDNNNGITVLSAGVPVRYVYVNFDTEDYACGDTFTVGESEAVGHIGNASTDSTDFVMQLFDIVSRHEDPDGGRIRDLLCLLQQASNMLGLVGPSVHDGGQYRALVTLRNKCQNTIDQMNGRN
jgi:hypothetical protein